MTIDTAKLTIKEAHDHLMRGDFTALELAETYLANIKAKDGDLHAYLGLYESTLEQARQADAMIKAGKATLLTGIPLSIKDNILVKREIVSSASKMLANYRGTYDATVIAKLRTAGAVFLGRTNMDEFAMGGSTENSAYGPSKNPHDLKRVPGGSSGGAAASVAGDLALAGLGSDTGGSIRQPASFCGLVGLKPTYGAVSRYGLMAMGSSFDVIGPLTKSVTDAEILYQTIAGPDVMDSTSIPLSNLSVKEKLVIGVPEEALAAEGMTEAVKKNYLESIEKFRKLGYEVRNVSLPNIAYSLAAYYTLIPAEVSSNLARFDGVRYGLSVEGGTMVKDYFATRALGFGPEVKRRIILGTYVLSSGYYDAYYNKANMVRDLIRADYNKAFANVDIILTPTTPSPAFLFGEKINDPLQLYLEDIFTVPVNLAGVPALSIPSGTTEVDGKKLPIGLQLIATHGGEATLFKVGKDFLGEK